ncbi:MAG: hypothetical protein JJE40_17290 [Vicinamibacteria bacterium]|nr:hypothetical protein [Vicinamibacteria bacterium]
MNEKTIVERVKTLENEMELLKELPAKVDQLGKQVGSLTLRVAGVESQIVQLRADMTDEFSAIRGELKGGLQAVRTELREDIASLGRETAAGFLRAGVQMRALFEEHLGRRAVIAEGNPTPDAPPRQ